jgi:hypothetical protein
MKKSMTIRLFVAVLAALAVGGCAHQRQFRLPDPARPQIALTPTGRLVVNQEPIVIVLNQNEPTPITWRLPPNSGLSFDPQGGITILGRIKNEKYEPIPLDRQFNSAFRCGLGDKAPATARADQKRDTSGEQAQAFTCAIDPKIPRGIYTYEINAVGPQGRIKLDPSIMPL